MNLVDAWPAALLYAMATLDSGLVGFRVAAVPVPENFEERRAE